MNDKKWKEETKLDRINKLTLSLYIAMTIFNIAIGIIEKNSTWILCSLLWFDLATVEYCNSKTVKRKNVLINTQQNIILQLLEKLSERPKIEEVDINSIKIPKYFKKPNEKKFNKRLQYVRENNTFKAPIIIDKDNYLKDGYTSYLIAKELGFVKIAVVRDEPFTINTRYYGKVIVK